MRAVTVILGAALILAFAAIPAAAELPPECTNAPTSAGAVPQDLIDLCAEAAIGERGVLAPTDTAAGWEGVAINAIAELTLNAPDVLTTLGGTSPTGLLISGCDFDGADIDTLYCIDFGNPAPTLTSTDLTTGVTTTLGTGGVFGTETMSSLDYDPTTDTMYGLSTSIDSGSLYTVSLADGSMTRIGATTSPCPIAGGFDASGQGYYYDLCDDSLYSFDKATGASTMIGALGFDANFAQGMDFDPDDDTCYLFAFNNGAFAAELRTCDTSTGATTLVGAIGSTSPGGLTEITGGGVRLASAPPPNPLEIPTVNAVGLALLALLLVGGALLLMRRRTA